MEKAREFQKSIYFCFIDYAKAQAWKPGSQHAGEKRGVAGLLLGIES